ncbi:MAG: sel1 repeat family protein [Lachnospiraceae bacterium]|nr:sel1 repeat family protein [Lachnospiraceae bacterium]
MGRFYSDVVETALRYLYDDVCAGKGAECAEYLRQASEAGDGDASCILARCYGGSEFVWSGHNFPEDYGKFVKYLHLSVKQGSALGVLLAVRLDKYTDKLKREAPISEPQEAFRIVLQKAEAGEPFSQYMIGNAYFWRDFQDIEKKYQTSFADKAAYMAYVTENVLKCEAWFQRALQGGCHTVLNNLASFYKTGCDGIVKPQPARVKEVYLQEAQRGYPEALWHYADIIDDTDPKEALRLYEQAAQRGQLECWQIVGDAYMIGKLRQMDVDHAIACYEKAAQQVVDTRWKIGAVSQLGYIYCEGHRWGRVREGEKAFPYLQYAVMHGNKRRIGCLGKCYFYGWGTERDFEKARECFETADLYDPEVYYLHGLIYVQGLGVAEDIEKGVLLLKSTDNLPEAKEELKKYKKKFLGPWVRR